MRKPRSPRIAILNQIAGGKTATSLENALSLVDRGHAVRVGELSIRLLGSAESRQQHATQQSIESEERYWRDVAVQRGGATISYEWRPRPSGGYSVMQAEAISR